MAEGKGIKDVCRSPEINPPTYHRWAKEYGGAKLDTVKRLKELVAQEALDIANLKEVAEGKW